MLLAVDIGNTNIDIGLFKEKWEKIKEKGKKRKFIWTKKNRLIKTFDIPTKVCEHAGSKKNKSFITSKIKKYIKEKNIKKILIASVVPSLNKFFKQIFVELFHIKPYFVSTADSKIKIKYKKEELGIDRLLDCLAAYEFFKKPAIVIDFGTATTFNCIDKNGNFIGGAIIPGPLIFSKSLSDYTEKLPFVKDFKKPKRIIGKTTKENIQIGLFYGYICLIKGLINLFRKEFDKKPLIIATGGYSHFYSKHIKEIKKVIPKLSLYGLSLGKEN